MYRECDSVRVVLVVKWFFIMFFDCKIVLDVVLCRLELYYIIVFNGCKFGGNWVVGNIEDSLRKIGVMCFIDFGY